MRKEEKMGFKKEKKVGFMSVEKFQSLPCAKFFLIAGKDYYYFYIGTYGNVLNYKWDKCQKIKTPPHKVKGCVNFWGR